MDAAPSQEPVQPVVEEEGEGLLSIPGLPLGWKARKTSKGKVLYFNDSTGESTYKASKVPGFEVPEAATSALPGTPDVSSPPPSKEEGVEAAAALSPSSPTEAQPTFVEVPGLPEGWKARLTSKGKTMYWCEETGESTYKLEKVPGYTAPGE